MKLKIPTAFLLLASLFSVSACAQQPAGNFNELMAGKLIRADGTEFEASVLKEKTVLVYFSAHWCPPCRRFTPELVKVYDEWKAAKKAVEIVFVSSDQDADSMAGYMTETKMNWLAVPFADEVRKTALSQNWSVRGIPTLVVVSPDGKTLTTSGVQEVYAKKAAALDAWTAPAE